MNNQTTTESSSVIFQDVRNLQAQCNSSINQASKSVFLNILGDPNLMTNEDVNIIADAFVTVYNSLSLNTGCDTMNSSRIVTFSSAENQTYDVVGTRLFSQKYTFEVVCSNCNPSNSMFRYPHLLDLPDDVCPCTTPPIQPFESDFMEELSILFDSFGVTHLKNITAVSDVVDVSPCPSYELFNTSNLWIDLNATCNGSETLANFQALAFLFKEIYNGLNLYNAETCDTYFRKIDNAAVNSIECIGDAIQLQLNVTARCRGCTSDDFTSPILFDIYDSSSNTKSEEVMDDDTATASSAGRRLQHIPSSKVFVSESDTEKLFPQTSSRRLEESNCGCPEKPECTCSIDPEYRTVTAEEIVAGMQSSTIGSIVLNVREEEKQNCSQDVSMFETTIEISLDESIDSDEAMAEFSRQFVLSYNNLASLYCDPYFRRLTSLNLIKDDSSEQRRDRQQATKKPKKMMSTGSVKYGCNGCSGNEGIITVRLQ
jgi:hypothetical protein